MVNPRPQKADLCRRERLAFAFGRHLHVLDQPCDVMNQGTLRTVTRHDVLTMLAPRQGAFAVI